MKKDAENQAKTLTRRRFLGMGGATLAGTVLLGARANSVVKPNILFIMTDDMSKWMLEHTPIVRQRMAAGGMTFDGFYGAQPLCSPNRASLLTGRYPHNHTVVNNNASARQFREKRLDQDTFATALKSTAGYRTALIGKYFNGYAASTENKYVPPGWDRWVGMAADSNLTILANIDGTWGDTGVSVTQESRWLSDHADAFIRANASVPWFCFLSFRAPHAPFTPSATSEHYADDIPLRRSENFNEPDPGGMSDKPQDVGLRLEPLGNRAIAKLETVQEGKLEELQDVDRQVDRLLDTISSTNQADRTYVFFTSDNGDMLGEHRQSNKNWAYEESSRLPLLATGPDVAVGSRSGALASMVDLRATFTNLAGLTSSVAADGRALTLLLTGGGAPPSTWRKRLLFERPPSGSTIGWHALYDTRYVYVEWSGGQKELYDMVNDAPQLQSVHASRPDLVREYSSQLAALKTAQGDALRRGEV